MTFVIKGMRMSRVYLRAHVAFVIKGMRMSRVYHRVHVMFVIKGMRCRECIIGYT